MATLKLRAIGNSVGAVFPRDVLARLGVKEGDVLHIVETKDGVVLTPLDPLAAGETGQKGYAAWLRDRARPLTADQA